MKVLHRKKRPVLFPHLGLNIAPGRSYGLIVPSGGPAPQEHARSHGGGGGEGGGPLEKIEPPLAGLGCPPWHFIGIGIEVYSPPGILSAPPTNDTWLRRCSREGSFVVDLSTKEALTCNIFPRTS